MLACLTQGFSQILTQGAVDLIGKSYNLKKLEFNTPLRRRAARGSITLCGAALRAGHLPFAAPCCARVINHLRCRAPRVSLTHCGATLARIINPLRCPATRGSFAPCGISHQPSAPPRSARVINPLRCKRVIHSLWHNTPRGSFTLCGNVLRVAQYPSAPPCDLLHA